MNVRNITLVYSKPKFACCTGLASNDSMPGSRHERPGFIDIALTGSKEQTEIATQTVFVSHST